MMLPSKRLHGSPPPTNLLCQGEGRGNGIQLLFKAWPRPTPGGSSASSCCLSGSPGWTLAACALCVLPTSSLLTCSSCSHNPDIPFSSLPQSVLAGWSWETLGEKNPMPVGVVKHIPCMHKAVGQIPSYNTANILEWESKPHTRDAYTSAAATYLPHHLLPRMVL